MRCSPYLRFYAAFREAFRGFGPAMHFGFIVCVLAVHCDRQAHGDMVVNGTAAQIDIRNANGTPSSTFFASGSNFTGIGFDTDPAPGAGVWGTLIAPDVILTASHFFPAQLTFTNSQGQTFTYATTSAVRNVGGTDLEVMRLSSPVDPSIPFYSIAPASQNVVGQQIIPVGQPFVAGLGSIASVTSQVLSYDYSATVPLSSYLTSGDSGGPTFATESNGDLALIGIHESVATGLFSNDTDVAGLLPEIDAAMTALGSPYQATVWKPPPPGTPEPSSLALVGIGLAAWYAVNRRRTFPVLPTSRKS